LAVVADGQAFRGISGSEEITVTAIPAATYREYLSSLLGGDRVACAEIVNQTLSQGTPMRLVHLDLFQASLYEVGERWATNQISVAAEHLATAVTEGLLNELYPRLSSARRVGKTVIVAGLQPELHQVGGKIVADTFEMHGWDSRYLGANVPADELRRLVRETQPDLVALSLAIYFNLTRLRVAIDELRREFPNLPMVVGGHGLRAGGAELLEQCPGVRYVSSLDELDGYIDQGPDSNPSSR
jgi:MerR family transcriptional regulator, light-induced transcriptional regulator